MPEISRFLGIVITMYFNDHNPPRVLGLVMEWAELHQAELLENWTTLALEGKFKHIAPLV